MKEETSSGSGEPFGAEIWGRRDRPEPLPGQTPDLDDSDLLAEFGFDLSGADLDTAEARRAILHEWVWGATPTKLSGTTRLDATVEFESANRPGSDPISLGSQAYYSTFGPFNDETMPSMVASLKARNDGRRPVSGLDRSLMPRLPLYLAEASTMTGLTAECRGWWYRTRDVAEREGLVGLEAFDRAVRITLSRAVDRSKRAYADLVDLAARVKHAVDLQCLQSVEPATPATLLSALPLAPKVEQELIDNGEDDAALAGIVIVDDELRTDLTMWFDSAERIWEAAIRGRLVWEVRAFVTASALYQCAVGAWANDAMPDWAGPMEDEPDPLSQPVSLTLDELRRRYSDLTSSPRNVRAPVAQAYVISQLPTAAGEEVRDMGHLREMIGRLFGDAVKPQSMIRSVRTAFEEFENDPPFDVALGYGDAAGFVRRAGLYARRKGVLSVMPEENGSPTSLSEGD